MTVKFFQQNIEVTILLLHRSSKAVLESAGAGHSSMKIYSGFGEIYFPF